MIKIHKNHYTNYQNKAIYFKGQVRGIENKCNEYLEDKEITLKAIVKEAFMKDARIKLVLKDGLDGQRKS